MGYANSFLLLENSEISAVCGYARSVGPESISFVFEESSQGYVEFLQCHVSFRLWALQANVKKSG